MGVRAATCEARFRLIQRRPEHGTQSLTLIGSLFTRGGPRPVRPVLNVDARRFAATVGARRFAPTVDATARAT